MARLEVSAVQIVDSADVPRTGAEWIAHRLQEAVAQRDLASLSLSGGHTPRRVYEELATLPVRWDRIAVFFGDERCVPPDDPDSNFRMAREALFDRVGAVLVHRIPAERTDLESVAAEYAKELPEAFDVLVLGMGEDGHTASLFPGHDWSRPPGAKVIVTPEVIWSARARLILATGASKASQVARALEGEADPSHYPIHLVRGATWLLDRAAASLLSR
jgi:6-phosphogluconolactonase